MKRSKEFIGKNFLIAAVSMLAGIILLCGLIGMLISRQVIPETMSPTATLILTEATILLCCYLAVKRLPQRRLPVSLALAAIIILLRLLVGTILCSEGELKPLVCLLTLGMGAAAGVLASVKKQRRR